MDRLSAYLYDVLRSCQEIEEETDMRGRSFDVFCHDRVYRRFVERNFEIIGEAMNRVLKLKPDIQISSARKIVNTRNLVIHSYDSLDKEILWSIVLKHIPILVHEIKTLLNAGKESSLPCEE
ncbi:MAG: DUF86 domain-containing protein [Muribaculaceae bacterium]|nr:DUF86 domain-containing protein [Muribaculaceae bacterium]